MVSFKVKDQVCKAAMDAMNNGEYMTILFYVRDPETKRDYIVGQTYNRCVFQCLHNPK